MYIYIYVYKQQIRQQRNVYQEQPSYKYGKSRKYHVKSINNTNLQPNGRWAPIGHRTIRKPTTIPLLSENQTSQNVLHSSTVPTSKGQIDNHNLRPRIWTHTHVCTYGMTICTHVRPHLSVNTQTPPLSLPLQGAASRVQSILSPRNRKGIRIEIGAGLPTEPPSIVVIAVRDVHHKFEFDFEFAPKHQQQRAQQWIRTSLEAGYHR